MSFSNVVRLIFPRDDRFYGILEAQGALLAQAGRSVLAFVEGEVDVEGAATAVQGLEPKSCTAAAISE